METKEDQNGLTRPNAAMRSHDQVPAEWLGLRQVSRYASISERTLRAWIHSPLNPLPAVRVCGKILVRRSELDTWLAKHRVKALDAVDIDSILKVTLGSFCHGR